MFANNVTIMKRKNLGNYEHKEVTISYTLSENEDENEALAKAEEFITNALNGVKPLPVNTKQEDEVKEAKEVVKKKVTKKKATKKAPAKKEPAKEYTEADVKQALRAYAEANQSKEMAVAQMKDVTGAEKLADVDAKDYAKLVKALEV